VAGVQNEVFEHVRFEESTNDVGTAHAMWVDIDYQRLLRYDYIDSEPRGNPLSAARNRSASRTNRANGKQILRRYVPNLVSS
jgi:hypothetical protein